LPRQWSDQGGALTTSTADVVICGAGIAGVSVAYHLAVRHGFENVILVDERYPLSLTSDKSTECYRNWWPGPGDAMVRLMNRSIDIMESLARESGNAFHLNRRGYLYATADPARIPEFRQAAEEISTLGAGPVRIHAGRRSDPAYIPAPSQGSVRQSTGADLILDPALIQREFPYLSGRVVAVLHARRCGWLSAQQLGMFLLERARERGVKLLRACVEEVEVQGGRVRTVRLGGTTALQRISTPRFVNAAGPFLKEVASKVGVDLPVFCELHAKVVFNDYQGVVPRDAPLLIWTDPQVIPWSEEERAVLAESQDTEPLLKQLPSGAHLRPEGGPSSHVVLMLWAYRSPPVEPTYPPAFDRLYHEVVLRGLCCMIPDLRVYLERTPRPTVDGGYYTKTGENRPLIGPLPVEGAYVLGALSGFGVMAACAAGELLAAHLTGDVLPSYAPWFALKRYEDPTYQRLEWGDSGQL
jgi:glycine/D-amino acid oxidase-like deaminating enzyme